MQALAGDGAKQFLEHEDVQRLNKAAALVEQWRARNDLFDVASVHWQTFWESPNANTLSQVEALLSNLDALALPDKRSDNLEETLNFFEASRQRIQSFLKVNEQQDGDRTQAVLAAFAAQKEFARCQQRLTQLRKYLDLQSAERSDPDWQWLRETIAWRDLFEKLRGRQKLDVDSVLWLKLRSHLQDHRTIMAKA